MKHIKGKVASENQSIVTNIRAFKVTLDCPNCGEEQNGWVVDPRGLEQMCDKCKQLYQVAADASVQLS